MSFYKACEYITNYSCAHESRVSCVGEHRLDYPDNHIEIDNRLSWFLGRLDTSYGDKAMYVYLKRNGNEVVNSFGKRQNFGIMKAYRDGIYMDVAGDIAPVDIAQDYLKTIDENILLFLKDKPYIEVNLENIHDDFQRFWHSIRAQGDLQKALQTFDTHYNAS